MDAGESESMLEIRRDSLSFVVKFNVLIAEVQCYFTLNSRDTSLITLVKTHIILMKLQKIDVQGHSKSSTFVAIESPYMTSY